MESLDNIHADPLLLQATSAQAEECPDKIISELRNRIAVLESTLLQRQEEIEQTRHALKSEQDKSQQIEVLNFKLKDADDWIFRLAGERQATERLLDQQGRRLKEAERRLAQQESRAKGVEEELYQQKYKLKEALLKIPLQEGELNDLRTSLLSSNSDLQDARSSVEKRFHELAILTKLLKEAEDQEAAASDQRAWLIQICSVLDHRPWWWPLAPKKWKMRYRRDRLRRMNLFDAQRYVELYPDVVAEGVDPVRHYISHGMKEGRICPR